MALLALAALSGGCGSGDEETTAASVSKAAFIKQADAVCSKTEKRQLALVAKFQQRGVKPGPKSELELVAFAGVPPLATEAEELRELPQPSSEAKQAKAFIAAFAAGVKRAEQDASLMLDLEKNPFTEAEQLAGEFGLKVCGGA